MPATTNTRGSLKKAYEKITQYTRDGAAFRSAYAANPQAACRLNRRSLCGAAAGTDDYVKLQVACSPAEYDARYNAGPNFNPIGPPKDQRPCQTAVAFAITAAAEAAVASALHINGSSISLSQQDLQFCPGIARGCYDNWDLESGLERLVNKTVVDYECLPYTAAQSDDPAKLCNYRCRNKPKAIVPGKFGSTPIRDVISAQKQIRRYGSFVTRFNLYDDFFPWISKTAVSDPNAVYDCPNTDKPAVDGHAVTVIGYNNDQGYWIVKNRLVGVCCPLVLFVVSSGSDRLVSAYKSQQHVVPQQMLLVHHSTAACFTQATFAVPLAPSLSYLSSSFVCVSLSAVGGQTMATKASSRSSMVDVA